MRDAYLRSFASFDDLCELAEEAEDPELKHLVRVVQGAANYCDWPTPARPRRGTSAIFRAAWASRSQNCST